MKLTPYLLLLLLLPTLTVAIAVEEKNSGFARGAIAFTVEHDSNDMEPAVIEGVRPTDSIRIIYGRTDSVTYLKYELFFKKLLNDAWTYYDMEDKVEKQLAVGETIDMDIDGDGTPEYELTFDSVGIREATFTLTPVKEKVIVETVVEEEPETEEPEPGAIIENESEMANETQENEGNEVMEPPKKKPLVPIIIGAIVLIVIVAFFVKRKRS